MKTKVIIAIFFFTLAASPLKAQFHAGSSFFIKANTLAAIDSVTLQPTTDLNLSGNELTVSYAPVVNTPPPGNSINRVAQFANPITYQGTIGLYYDNAELNGNTATQLNLLYHTGQGGYSNANLFTTANSNNHVTATTGIQTITLSKLTAANTGTVLPLQLLSLDAYKENAQTIIKWQTANEKDIAHFEVEKSGNAKDYSFLEKQNAGNVEYIATDSKPLNGWNYYRLKITETNGAIAYSPTVKVWFDEDKFPILLYPNPVAQSLNVQLHAAAKQAMKYAVFSADGRQLMQGKLAVSKGDNHFMIDFSHLPAGNYLFKTDNGFFSKIIKE